MIWYLQSVHGMELRMQTVYFMDKGFYFKQNNGILTINLHRITAPCCKIQGENMADLNKAKRNPFLKSGKKEEKNTNKADTPLQHKLARHKVLMIYRICFVVALVGVFLVCAYIHWMNGPDHRKRTVLILPILCLLTVKMV